MKTFILTLISFVAFGATAVADQTETKVCHPIVVDDSMNSHISVVNKVLSKADRFPEYFEVSHSETPEAADSRWIN